MNDLSLYRVVGGMNRVALGALADNVEFYTAEQDDNGVITLTPVNVVGSIKRTTPSIEDQPLPGV